MIEIDRRLAVKNSDVATSMPLYTSYAHMQTNCWLAVAFCNIQTYGTNLALSVMRSRCNAGLEL
jgi:hypothetical protein